MKHLYRVHDRDGEHWGGYCLVAADYLWEAARLVGALPDPLPQTITLERVRSDEGFWDWLSSSLLTAQELADSHDEPKILMRWWLKPTEGAA